MEYFDVALNKLVQIMSKFYLISIHLTKAYILLFTHNSTMYSMRLALGCVVEDSIVGLLC